MKMAKMNRDCCVAEVMVEGTQVHKIRYVPEMSVYKSTHWVFIIPCRWSSPPSDIPPTQVTRA